MKRIGNLFEKVHDFENLLTAFGNAFRGKRSVRSCCLYDFNLEREILMLQDELKSGIYKPGRYRYFKIFEPKARVISVAPFRDRIVHHALINVIGPLFESRFIHDSYATRKDKGTHKAIRRAQQFFRHDRYYLKFDIRKYFDNISHDILLGLLNRKIKDTGLLSLLEIIIKNSDLSRKNMAGRGLPIGNLTSQFFANVYLDLFDHYIKDELGIRRYVRYMDDCVMFDNRTDTLKDYLRLSEDFLVRRLGLEIKEKSVIINSGFNGLPFLGYRIFPSTLRLKKENIRRLKTKLKLREGQLSNGIISEEKFYNSTLGIINHVQFADSLKLRRDIFFRNKGSGVKRV
ncbi:MAG: RNA-directed DNA polymerase (Reverse transcriptase) [Planctomycetes bacterium]|nr:RNA-directed DNA polymerase (Reverse transcriptase) [Planctomycetota bacterium]